MIRTSKKKNLTQIIHLQGCSPEFYEHTAVIQANFQRVKNPLVGYGLNVDAAIADLRAKGYQGDFIFAWITNPKKNYVFVAA